MISQKASYGKRVISLPTVPEISPTQKVLGKSYTQPFKKRSYGSNCLLKTKLLYQLQGKKSHFDLHTGCNWALRCNYDQCNKNRSIRVATHVFIKLKSPSCTGCSRAVTFPLRSSPCRTMGTKRSQMCSEHGIGLHTLASTRQGSPAASAPPEHDRHRPLIPGVQDNGKTASEKSPADTWLVQVWC